MVALQMNQTQTPRYGTAHLWLGDTDAKNDSPRQPGAKPDTSSQREARILIVEDEVFVAWHLEDILRDLDLDICGVASDGRTAIDKTAELKPDVVFMDIHLSGPMDGIETARRIRQISGANIVFITAYSDDGMRKRIQAEVPGAPVLAKPASLENIWAAIGRLVDKGRGQ
jgi:CheY-like chemotaxis protein